jgi:hypothetical protein
MFSIIVNIKNLSNNRQILNDFFIYSLDEFLHFYSFNENNTNELLVPWMYRIGGGEVDNIFLNSLQEFEFTINFVVKDVVMGNYNQSEYSGLALILENIIIDDFGFELECGYYYQLKGLDKLKIQFNTYENISPEYIDNRFENSNDIILHIDQQNGA